jgi:quercetin dioxygenase-like cupin family protein
MRIFRNNDSGASKPVDAQSFVGAAHTKLFASADDGAAVRVYRVDFESGARTNWHTHSGAQWLFIVSGRIRAQRWGEPAIDLDDGDAVAFAPREKHWHGAVPGSRGTHLAVNINVHTEWLEAVSDDDYAADT